MAAATPDEDPRRQGKVDRASAAIPPRTREAHRTPEDGVRHSGRRMDPRAAAAMGGRSAPRARAPARRLFRACAHTHEMGAASVGRSGLAIGAVVCADVPGVARRGGLMEETLVTILITRTMVG